MVVPQIGGPKYKPYKGGGGKLGIIKKTVYRVRGLRPKFGLKRPSGFEAQVWT